MRRRAFLAAGALLALRPASALAASDEGGLLLGLWQREAGAALAYSSVPYADDALLALGSQERDHAAALATQLSAMGFDTPPAPRALDAVDIGAQLLAGAGPGRKQVLAAAIALEKGLVELYTSALPALPDAKVAMTVATILASHSQHLFILRSAAGVL
jgi:hypothetical protein